MHKQSNMRAIVALALTLYTSAGLLPSTALAGGVGYKQPVQQRSAAAMAVDAIAVRPLGIVATALGTGLFIVSLPFSALGGNVGEAADALVVAPAKFTFTRPLGEYDTYR
jgi:hypothetical protein